MPLGVGRGQNVGLRDLEIRDFCHILTLLPPGASVFHKHMSSSTLLPPGAYCSVSQTHLDIFAPAIKWQGGI